MKSRYSLIVFGALILQACSFSLVESGQNRGGDVEIISEPPREAITTIDEAGSDYSSKISEAQVFDNNPAVRHYARGSVEVYSLDAAPAKTALVSPQRLQSGGHAVSNQIEVFPLDSGDGTFRATPLHASHYGSQSMNSDMMPQANDVQYVMITKADGTPIRVYFDHGSADINAQGIQVIKGLASAFSPSANAAVLSVEGHASTRADASGATQRKIVNLEMSMKRSLSVAEALINAGIPAEYVRVVAWGEVKPSSAMDGRSAEAASRRVELVPYTK